MSAPNRSLPGRGQPQRPSSSSGSDIAPQSVPPSSSSHQQSGPVTQQEAIRSLLTTNQGQFEALSPEIQQKVLRAFDWLLLSQETQDSLEAKRRAKQAEANARQAEADWLAKAICSCKDSDQDAINFLRSVLLGGDDERDSPILSSDTY